MAKIQRSNMVQKDSKGKVIRKPKETASETANLKWWTVDEKDMAGSIAATLKFIQTHQSSRIEQLTISTRLYGNSSAYNLMGTAFSRTSSASANPSTQRLSFNLCASVIETLEAKMARNKIVPTYITNGGIWDVQKKAKDLTKFTQGLFYQEKVHDKAIEAFSDAGVWGDGLVKVYRKNDKVAIERVLPHELWVDQIETMVTEPTQMHHPKIMDRDVALELYPDLADEILSCNQANYQEIGGQGSAADLIVVVESWHLKSGPDKDDGLHVISINKGVITEPYDKDYFPFPHLRYVKRKLGWYGQGACERLQNLQGEINRGMILKQRSMWMMGSFKVLLENGSKVVTQHLNNEVGTLIHYTGTAPQYITPPSTNPEIQQWIDSLIQKGYQQEGVPQMASTGEAPMGVDSGKALRTLSQIGDDRFTHMGQDMEDFVLEIARQAVEVVKDIYADTKTYEVVFPANNFCETVDWASIDLDNSEYVLKAFPTSSLSDDLTGRLAEVQELAQAGMITPRTARKLLSMPDLEMNENLVNAAEDLMCDKIEKMIFDKEPYIPQQFNDLALAKQLALQYYNYAQLCNAPDDVLGILRDFLAQISDLDGTSAPPMPPQQAGPQAVPMAPPQSNMLPNVPQGVQQ